MKKYVKLMEKFKNKRIIVLGDFILDEYVFGETERISREAPVLILKHNRSTYLAGGGANPVMNIKALGAEPIPVSAMGTEASSEILLDIMNSKKINTSFIVRDVKWAVPVKARIMAGSVHTVKQQIVRIDKESEDHLPDKAEKMIIRNLNGLVETADAMLVSDYGGGVLTNNIIKTVNALAKKGMKVIVDSRYALKKYRYIAAATPNETEAGPLVEIEKYGDEDVKRTGKKLISAVKAKGLIITRGSRGMMIFEKGRARSISAFGSDEIVDVSGAGDTVSSIVALALGCGAALYDAAYLANIGGGLVVMERGAATITPAQLKKALKNVKN